MAGSPRIVLETLAHSICLSLSTGRRRLIRQSSIGVALWTARNHRNSDPENALNPHSALDSKSPIQSSGDDCLMELRWFYDRRDLAEVRRDLAAWLAKWQGN
jgi:hypothetical protein